jgi:hypothetical protein
MDVGCIHADASWCFLSVQGFKRREGANQVLSRILWSIMELTLICLKENLSLQGYIIFFTSSKYFISIHRCPKLSISHHTPQKKLFELLQFCRHQGTLRIP